MPHISQLGSSKFISQADCMKPLLLTIKGCHQDEVGQDDGDKEEKWCLDFEEIKKSLVLNQTNGELLGEVTGKETIEEMVGYKVVLYVDPNVKFGKKKVGGVRVRAPKQPPNQPPQQPFRQLALHLEAGPRRQRLDREARHDAPPRPPDIKVMQERDMTIPPSGKAAPCPRIGAKEVRLDVRWQSSRWEHPFPRTGYALPARGQIYWGGAAL